MLKVEKCQTSIPDCFVMEFYPHRDDRGTFDMNYHFAQFAQLGLHNHFVQDNVSISLPKVVRGLHHQMKNPQGKFVRVISGEIVDVVVDVRPDSPERGRIVRAKLGPFGAIYVPPGCLHGFAVTSDLPAVVYYKCTTLFDPDSQVSVNPLDERLGIQWGDLKPEELILSEKDRAGISLDEFLKIPV